MSCLACFRKKSNTLHEAELQEDAQDRKTNCEAVVLMQCVCDGIKKRTKPNCREWEDSEGLKSYYEKKKSHRTWELIWMKKLPRGQRGNILKYRY